MSIQDQQPPAIATLYGGVQYRSRLEARWAAFFDQLKWPYQYEPFDLNGWIPDFVLMGAVEVLIEVKPCLKFPAFVLDKIQPATRGWCDDDHEILVVGCTLLQTEWPDVLSLGWLVDDTSRDWDPAPIARWYGSESEAKNPGRILGFCNGVQSFRDRITGCYDGGSYGICDNAEITEIVLAAWNHAGNLVQWNGKQSITDARSKR